MKIQTRKRIFYVLVLLFIVIGAAVVSYAEGWRINFSTLVAEKAGGIYVHSYPDNAQITLNGKPIQNQSGFLSPGTFISGLFPKNYTLTLKATGYDAWTEMPQVVPSLVTEMKYAVLVPNKATNVATGTAAVAGYFEAAGNVVVTNANATVSGVGKIIGYGTVVSHSTNLKTAVIRAVNAKTGIATYSLYDFTNATSTNFSTLLRASGIKSTTTNNIFVDPYDDTSVIARTPAQIVAIEADTHRATIVDTAPAGETIESPIAVSPSVMAWARYTAGTPTASGTSQIVVYDKFSGDTVDESLIVKGPITQLAWVRNNILGILGSDNTLYLYNVSNEQLTSLANDVKHFYPAADGSSLAALEYHSLEIFSFTTQNYYRFNLPEAANVQGLIWYKDDAHLFVQYPDRVAFLDFADTNLKNLTTVSAGTDPSYDAQENSLYLIDQGQKLLRFDFPQ
ncbi:MAG TPA: hypothetical protein VIJ29_03790 [Candidatus Paceibacterota bacterium]